MNSHTKCVHVLHEKVGNCFTRVTWQWRNRSNTTSARWSRLLSILIGHINSTYLWCWRLWFFLWSCMDVRIGLWRRLSTEELMLLNCGVGEESWVWRQIWKESSKCKLSYIIPIFIWLTSLAPALNFFLWDNVLHLPESPWSSYCSKSAPILLNQNSSLQDSF